MVAGYAASDLTPLLDLVDRARWQRLQDHFSGVLGITIRTISPSHELLASPSWPSSLPAEHVVRLLKVGEELEQLLPPPELPSDIASLTTPVGVTYAAVPIRAAADRLLAYFVVGPMVVGPREEEWKFRQRMGAMGLDAQALWSTLLSLKLYTFAGLRSVLNLMEEVGSSLAQFAYQAHQLAALLPKTERVDQAAAAYYTDRVHSSLLETAAMATNAEGGSVMVYQSREDAFRIRAAQGLSDAVVAAVRVKRGEGLAGVAAAERTILLVDDRAADARLKPLMTRRDLASSIVAPITLEAAEEPIGVLSLRTSNAQQRFTRDHVELLRRLLTLAGIALASFRSALTTPRSSAS